jgi:hypothetical protein
VGTLRQPSTLDPETGHSIFSLMPSDRQRKFAGRAGDELVVQVDDPPRQRPAGDGGAVPAPPAADIIAEVSALERGFPSVAALLLRVWRRPEINHAFRTLLLDKRGMVRQWPQEVWDELVLLRDVHHRQQCEAGDAGAGLVDPAAFSILEVGYGHVIERLIQCWGDPNEFRHVFEDLVIDSRGDREGWPPDLWRELLFLQEVHHRVEYQQQLEAERRVEAEAPRQAAEAPLAHGGLLRHGGSRW